MKEHSRFYSSLGLLILLNVIIKPVWIFLIDRQVQNIVGPETYGAYFSLLNFSIVFSFLLDWGLTNYFNRELAAKQEMTLHIGDFFLTRLIFSILYMIVVLGLAWISGISNWKILCMVTGIQVLTSFFIFFRSIITAKQMFRTDAWLSVMDKTLMVVICGGFIYFPATVGMISIERFLQIQIICTALAIVCTLLILFKEKIAVFQTNKGIVGKRTIIAALPYGLVVLLMSAHYRLDGFLLERIHENGAYEAGVYAAAYRLLDAANMIGFLFASFLMPFIARRSRELTGINGILLNSRHVLMLFSGTVAAIAIFLAPWINRELYHTTDAASSSAIQLCLPALVGYALVHVYGTVLTATGRIIPFLWIVLISLVINILLNILLIPGQGAKGSCIAALVSQGFCGACTMLYATRNFDLPIHARSLLLYTFIVGAAAGLLYLSVNSGLNNWLGMIMAGLVVIVLGFVTKLFSIKAWTAFFQKQ